MPRSDRANTVLTHSPAMRPLATWGFSQPRRSGPPWLLSLHPLSSSLPAPRSQTSRPTFSFHCPIKEACLGYFWNNRFNTLEENIWGLSLFSSKEFKDSAFQDPLSLLETLTFEKHLTPMALHTLQLNARTHGCFR